MLLQFALTIAIFIIYWLWQLQPKSPYTRRVYNVLQVPPLKETDFVIVGAGPGGLAAAHHLVEKGEGKSVLVLEHGVDTSSCGRFVTFTSFAQKSNLVLFSRELVGTKLDGKWKVHYPLRGISSDSDATSSSTEAAAAVPYPRGRAVGGTSVLDWALYMKEIPVHFGKNLVEAPFVPHRFTIYRNPLSWGFAESAGTVLGKKHLASMTEPAACNSVFPGLLRLDEDGRRLPLSQYLINDHTRNLSVVERCKVTGLLFDDKGSVTGVQCESVGSSRVFKVAVRKGVILSAGILGTARLLKSVFPKLQERFLVRDCIALPFILQARSGISDDPRNVCSFKAHVAWWTAQRGPFLNPVCDTLAVVDLPFLGPFAELVIFLLPFGGRDPALYRSLGIDYVLGVFSEGFIMLMVLRGIEDAFFELLIDGTGGNDHMRLGECASIISLVDSRASTLTEKVVDAFMEGILLCRKIVAQPPLLHLSTGQEAVDATLLGDSSHAIQYTRLMRTTSFKLTARQKAEAHTLLAWVKETTLTPAYMKSYICRHAVWLGFGSGSCSPSRASEESLRVAGTQNVFLGDCSAVTETMLKACGGDTLRAGSVSTAMALGKAAAMELLSI